MATNIRRLGVLVALAAVMLLAVALLSLSYVEVGKTDEIGSGGIILSAYDLSAVPQSVVDDATGLAQELFGDSRDKYGDFANQLLASYAEAEGKDFIVVFNSGGWGWNFPDSSPGWSSILTGISSELDELGYESVMLNYRRTTETVRGIVKESIEVATHYPSKARDLACRVDFLTAHNPDLKVIVTGESNGSVISDGVMVILQDNPQVYSIQTGTPFWHKPVRRERALVLNSNGIVPDSFSDFDVPTMLRASLKNLLGLSTLDEEPGMILNYVRAPGHDYSWQYPQVSFQISSFIVENFGIKQ